MYQQLIILHPFYIFIPSWKINQNLHKPQINVLHDQKERSKCKKVKYGFFFKFFQLVEFWALYLKLEINP